MAGQKYALERIAPLALELGVDLIHLVDAKRTGAPIIAGIKASRQALLAEQGLVLPPISVRDNLRFDNDHWKFVLRNTPIVAGTVRVGHLLATVAAGSTPKLEGQPCTHPITNRPAVWIPESGRAAAEALGAQIDSPADLIVSTTCNAVRTYWHEHFGFDALAELLDRKATAAAAPPTTNDDPAESILVSAWDRLQRMGGAIFGPDDPVETTDLEGSPVRHPTSEHRADILSVLHSHLYKHGGLQDTNPWVAILTDPALDDEVKLVQLCESLGQPMPAHTTQSPIPANPQPHPDSPKAAARDQILLGNNPVLATELVDRLSWLSKDSVQTHGVTLPDFEVVTQPSRPGGSIELVVHGESLFSTDLDFRVGTVMAIDPGDADPANQLARRSGATSTTDPAFGLPAYWVLSEDRQLAQGLGYTVVDQRTVVTTLLQTKIAQSLAVFVDLAAVEQALTALRAHAPALHAEFMRLEQAQRLTRVQVCDLLQKMVAERVSILDREAIFEALVLGVNAGQGSASLLQAVRQRLRRAICASLSQFTGNLELIEIHPNAQSWLDRGRTPTTPAGSLEPATALDDAARQRFQAELLEVAKSGEEPVLLAPPHLRAALVSLVARSDLELPVLSSVELDPNVPIVRLGIIGEGLANSHDRKTSS